MEIDIVERLITTVGFPIVCVLGLAYFIYRSYQTINNDNRDREAKLYEMLGKTQAQLDQAQDTNAKFISVLEQINHDTEAMKADIDDIKDTIKKLPKRKTDTAEE